MKDLRHKSAVGIGIFLLSFVAHAEQLEEAQSFVGKMGLYALILIAIVVAFYVYFMRLQDKRATPLNKIFEGNDAIHFVGPNALVIECVKTMSGKKIGAMLVMEEDRLLGIFTERDALNKVLAAGLDPRSTKVSEVMTRNPQCVPPTTTVGAAMKIVTTRRFRHLPVVQDGKVLGVLSSGDLTHWMVKDQMGEIQELVDLAARS